MGDTRRNDARRTIGPRAAYRNMAERPRESVQAEAKVAATLREIAYDKRAPSRVCARVRKFLARY